MTLEEFTQVFSVGFITCGLALIGAARFRQWRHRRRIRQAVREMIGPPVNDDPRPSWITLPNGWNAVRVEPSGDPSPGVVYEFETWQGDRRIRRRFAGRTIDEVQGLMQTIDSKKE